MYRQLSYQIKGGNLLQPCRTGKFGGSKGSEVPKFIVHRVQGFPPKNSYPKLRVECTARPNTHLLSHVCCKPDAQSLIALAIFVLSFKKLSGFYVL